MSDTTADARLTQLESQIQSLTAATTSAAPAAMTGMAPAGATPMMPAMAMAMPHQTQSPEAVLFRIEVPLPDGSVLPGYVSFPGAAAPSPQALQVLAAQVAMAWPVRSFHRRQQGWGGNQGGYGGGGGNDWGRRGGYGGRRY